LDTILQVFSLRRHDGGFGFALALFAFAFAAIFHPIQRMVQQILTLPLSGTAERDKCP